MSLRIFLFSLVLISTSALGLGPQDIMIKSRFDLESSKPLITTLRNFLTQSKFGDPFEQKFEKTIVIDLSTTFLDMPTEAQAWVHELQSVLKLRLFESDYRMVIEGLKYSVVDFDTDFMPNATEVPNRVEYVTRSHVKGFTLGADSLSFQIELKQTQSGQPIRFMVELIGPSFEVHPDLLLDLPMGWDTTLTGDKLIMNLSSVNLEHIFKEVLRHPHLIQFKALELRLPQVSIKVGDKVVSLDHEKLKAFFQGRQEDLKLGILNIIKSKLGHVLPNIMKDRPKTLALSKSFAITGLVNMVFDLKEMQVTDLKMLELFVGGEFCEREKSLLSTKCKTRQILGKKRREITVEMYQRSSRALDKYLMENSTNFAVSLSEDLINRLIFVTVKNGLWQSPLDGNDFALSDEGAFILAEDEADTFSLFLDIVYTLKGRDRVLTGASKLRFPVKMKIALKVGNKDDVPHFKIVVKEIVTNHQSLLRGYPEYGLHSNIGAVPRFQGKVLESVMRELRKFDQQELISIDLPELKGTYLEKLNFHSDGLGRANATLNF